MVAHVTQKCAEKKLSSEWSSGGGECACRIRHLLSLDRRPLLTLLVDQTGAFTRWLSVKGDMPLVRRSICCLQPLNGGLGIP